MMVLGLTGSIGMGKSATAAMFAAAGVPVYDADAEVARLYAAGGAAVEPVGQMFPGVVKGGAIDREALRKAVIGKAEALAALEAIVHPLAAEAQKQIRAAAEARSAPFVLLDIPLLFETGGDKACDLVAVVTAPGDVQRKRVLSRPGMTPERFEAILAKQTPDAEKRAKADFVISTAFGFDFTRAHVAAIVELLTNQAARQE